MAMTAAQKRARQRAVTRVLAKNKQVKSASRLTGAKKKKGNQVKSAVTRVLKKARAK